MDVLIFGGQSNMQGQTESCPDRTPIEGAFEYRHRDKRLLPLAHPVGEDLADLLLRAAEGNGSILPAFCGAYRRATGRYVTAVHAARGATILEQWKPGCERYLCALGKIRAGIAAAENEEKVERVVYLWLQGESDAIRIAGEVKKDPARAKEIYAAEEKRYYDDLVAYRAALVRDVKIDLFGIIKVGYFSCLTTWAGGDREADETIMRAQEAVSKRPGFAMLTRVCPELSLTKEYMNPSAAGHYNNAATEIVGTLAGNALAALLK